MKILVTGTAGFIGRHLAPELLHRGHAVLGLDRRNVAVNAGFSHVVCDLLDAARVKQTVLEFAPDAVVHLAARTDLDEKNDLNGYAVNFRGTENLIEAVEQVGSVRRAIYTSSQLVCRYGYRPAHQEDYAPDSLYGRSKVEMEKIVRRRDGGGTTWCLVRPTTVWGPGMGPHYRRFLRLLRKGRYFHIGSGALMKSYSYIENIVHQYARLLEVPAELIHRKTLYLSDYEMLSTRWYADELARAMRAPRVPTYPEPLARFLARIGDVINAAGFRSFPFNTFRLGNILTEVHFDLAETESIAGPLPVDPAEGVRRTADWFLAFEAGDPKALWTGGVLPAEVQQ